MLILRLFLFLKLVIAYQLLFLVLLSLYLQYKVIALLAILSLLVLPFRSFYITIFQATRLSIPLTPLPPSKIVTALLSISNIRVLALDNRQLGLVRTELREYALDPDNLYTFLQLARTKPNFRPLVRRLLYLSNEVLLALGLNTKLDDFALDAQATEARANPQYILYTIYLNNLPTLLLSSRALAYQYLISPRIGRSTAISPDIIPNAGYLGFLTLIQNNTKLRAELIRDLRGRNVPAIRRVGFIITNKYYKLVTNFYLYSLVLILSRSRGYYALLQQYFTLLLLRRLGVSFLAGSRIVTFSLIRVGLVRLVIQEGPIKVVAASGIVKEGYIQSTGQRQYRYTYLFILIPFCISYRYRIVLYRIVIVSYVYYTYLYMFIRIYTYLFVLIYI